MNLRQAVDLRYAEAVISSFDPIYTALEEVSHTQQTMFDVVAVWKNLPTKQNEDAMQPVIDIANDVMKGALEIIVSASDVSNHDRAAYIASLLIMTDSDRVRFLKGLIPAAPFKEQPDSHARLTERYEYYFDDGADAFDIAERAMNNYLSNLEIDAKMTDRHVHQR